MKKEKEIRLLKASEIECRVNTINENGISLLLHIDGRVAMKLLDETFTPMGWKKNHQLIDGNLYCTVSVWDEVKQQWIDKQDVGVPAYSQKEKSQASDSFKRSCVLHGVARELYTAPFIWIAAAKCEIYSKGEVYKTKDSFKVKSIAYNAAREIVSLSIINQKGIEVYRMNYQERSPEEKEYIIEGPTVKQMEALSYELERTGVNLDTVLGRYGITTVREMTPDIYSKAMNSLRKTSPKAA